MTGAYNTVPIVQFLVWPPQSITQFQYRVSYFVLEYNVTLGSIERSSKDGENRDAFRAKLY